ncbi:hypothetical protein A3H10_03680 [Candidatus Uhrbacteria bacterium RIFCSPLOWO2_12_FULL_46_10]|uniref:Uncharacterized protein n=1 Tax=Candidatus Uhrbacteria bacterium RIFCSPLOWO2_01_FULL_47_25 TaxID=1802402 RepID=A0A1F7UV77_9BACT|nr:MAG: hypothetical protein UX68_C0011G0049 [Parcubacteria group bacterium GW2011_GWA2_46_9]OGL59088.1 MAG: hypothetical protein A2752_02635 [Candidatus Uhrbacteria bacterium RIFCSPHIGHO2_01_FULL_46_23]OGL68754.1 MAG: hypothetical protein A3D60_02235 [Candidatus Uhrbacteria bacterium RIFCSPHIGHO2_02_FULL_47_29]OGL74780.1 MAG: hypothetical protein A3E96_03520 [Candidatus Uhrbacteria bacterium RIFCSPHIGHO2_12_FULL_46_13]OGL82192.1 MAG: hypothetical protein A2936_01355 [Candidatus Uhrbacteria bac
MDARSTFYAKALLDSWEKAPESERGQVADRFVELLRVERMLPLAPNILDAIERLLAERLKEQAVRAEFAHEPTSRQRESLKHFWVSEVCESMAVIGGFKISGRHKIIDASVAGGLEQMRQALILE